ncbi:retrovirus-related pol polyprotein from transposon TNT 1-94 [Tanacetum coccineum]
MDSIISLGQKNTLAEYMILSGADNRPPMLDKDLYDSWKIEENGVIRTKKYAELSAAEKIQADCDMKATNIILQGLPADIYSLVNHHRVAKDLWERVQLLMQGTSLTKQERECKLYDAFDKFTHIKGESLHTLPPEWSKFVTDVKLVKDLHTSNFDQLHAYLEQHELYANDVRIMRERNQDPLAFIANQQMTPRHFNTYQSYYNNPQLQQQFSPSQHGSIQPNQQYSSHYPSQTQFNHSSIPPSHTFQSQMNHQTSTVPQVIPQVAYQSPQAHTQPMTESPFRDSGSVVPVFSPGDDLIACLNKAMAFLTVVASSRFPTTNNQLRTSSNLRNQATIQDGRVTVQQVQGRQGQNYSGTTYKSNATSSRGNTTSGQARVVKCYNCQGEGHMARQCTQPKRPRNAAWYKEKAMLAEAQEAGQILDEEQLAFLADPGIPADQAQTIIPHNAAFQTEDLDTYDSDCDDLSTAQAVLMANISNYGSDIISEVPNSETYLNDMDNQSVQALQDFEQTPVMDFTDNKISSDSNIIPYSQYLQETQQATVQDTNLQAQQDSMILSVIEQIYKERVKTFEQRLNIDLSSREKMIDSQMDDMIREKLALKEQIDSLEQNLSKQIKENESLFKTFSVFKNESKEKENKYMENEIDLEKKIKELDNIICKVGQSAQTVHMFNYAMCFRINTHKQALGYQNPFYLKKAQRIKPTLYDGAVMSKTHVAMPVIDDEETLILEEESRSKMSEKAKDPEVIAKKISHKPIDYENLNSLTDDFEKRFSPQQELSAEQAFWFHILNPSIESSYTPPVIVEVPSELPKVSLVNASLKKLKFHLTQFDSVVKKRITPNALEEGEWGFEHTKTVFNNEIIPFLKSLKDIFNVFDKDLLNEITEVQTVFDQMDAAVQQSLVDKQCLEIAKKEILLENDRLLQKIMSQDMLLTGKEIVENVVHIPSATTITPGMFKLDLEPLPPRQIKGMIGSHNHQVGTKKYKVRKPKPGCPNYTLIRERLDCKDHGGMVTISWETLLSLEYTTLRGLDIICFLVGQFCDGDLEVAFRKNTCFIHNLEGVDLLLGSRDTNLYTISLDDMLKSSLICLLSKVSKTKSWLWHHWLSHSNFGTLNKLAKDGLARGIPRLKFQKDHLCSACAFGKTKKSSHQPKAEDTNQEKLFLKTKDEAPAAIIKCIKNIQVRLKATVQNVRTDNGTEFVNQTLREWYENVGITHQTSDDHLRPYTATESDEVIKSSVENLVPDPNDDDSFSIDDIEYVEASPPDFELFSLEAVESVIPEVRGIDTDILLTIKDDILREKKICSTTTHSDSSLYKCDSFIFDLSIDPFPPADRSDVYHEQFADELGHIISPPE